VANSQVHVTEQRRQQDRQRRQRRGLGLPAPRRRASSGADSSNRAMKGSGVFTSSATG
jgi:hypothetical protein